MHGRQQGAYGNAVERLRPPQESVVIHDIPSEGRRNWTYRPNNFTVENAKSAGWSSESRQQIALFTDFGAVALAIEPDEPNLLSTLREEK
ncbi:uncharacterized protein B0T23DRAFT_205733 [Neurospora hispaniola]|uniref:Uncharacterized protein n=1 Tax=Neurospora hispaniola TaxID=588809 RepID=A0AAJ0I1S5_9PEZI|nr:hypothetical protein B0T23DRAFT_205733 [Neurospora hispaniola]